ncbi:amino acid transporter [Mollisia scopiformis]|uniref:Amino acid transporter n=1 Tax=Mollisia scopiformis TaxID=149040 RepID=A0A194XIW6_MOLSC|nr:amino acid transporter [Mollisia scopiformis]KUJ19707.1 amino acid transporter [Mollisia scopiformis]
MESDTEPAQINVAERNGTTQNLSDAVTLPTQRLSARDGFVLLIGIQIGSGIFTSPAQVDQNVASPAAALLAWTIAGLIAWAGATSFAELGVTLPSAGGMQEYLRYVYGDMTAFTMSWIWIMVEKPVSMAILSILLAESVSRGYGSAASVLELKLVSCMAALTIALLTCYNTKPASQIGQAFVVMKFFTVGLIMLSAIVVFTIHFVNPASSFGSSDWYEKSWISPRPANIDWPALGWWTTIGYFSAAINGAFWSYAGWENANFIAGEMKDPPRNLPRAVHLAMISVMFCFLTCNVSYYILLPWSDISLTDAIAVAAAKTLFGGPGQFLIAMLVALSCAGSLNGNSLVVARLTVAAASKGYVPKSSTSVKRFLRSYSILLNVCITLFCIVTGSFHILVTFIGIAQYSFYFLTVLGLLILRVREPSLPRLYKTSVLIPVIFCIASGLVVIRTVIFLPSQGLIFAGLVALGLLISRVRRNRY